MNQERLYAASTLVLLPALVYFLAIRPSTRRLHGLKERIAAARAGGWPLKTYTPVDAEERKLLEDPAAPWRARIPVAADDGERLNLADRVVGQVGAAMRKNGVKLVALRALLDPVKADFTLAPELVARARPAGHGPAGTPEDRMQGWVLELEIAGPTGELFKALAAAAGTEALLEPVGLRWSAPAGGGKGRQYLLLRSYYLQP